MISLTIRKILIAFAQLFAVATLVFSIMYIMPGDPVMMLMGAEASPSPEAVAAMRAKLGLDQPVMTQYVHWLVAAAHGDLGTSLQDGYSISATISRNLPRTLELAAAAVLIAMLIGVPLGMMAALKRGTRLDTVLTSLSTVGISVPVYILGAMLILLFALRLDWLPASGYMRIERDPVEHFRRLLLPAFTLGLGLSASIARMTRSSVLDLLDQDFIRALRAKGTPERRIIWRHVLRNAAIPVVTIIGLQLGSLMGGAVLVEAMFNWPGLSTLLVKAVQNRDYPLVQGVILAIAGLYILINLLVDLLYSLLDPRVRGRR